MNTEAASLLQQIVHCPIAEQWYKDVTKRSATNPCHVIIDHQFNGFDGAMGAKNLTDFQVPEPWRGHIQQARLLFISSNPSIGRELFPHWSWSLEEIASYFEDSFDPTKGSIVDGAYMRNPNGSRGNYQRFWGGINSLAKELIDSPVPGEDYALTEVVHCKSRKEVGVEDKKRRRLAGALYPCARRYLKQIIAVSQARVVVVVGRPASKAFYQQALEKPYPQHGPAWGTVLESERLCGRARSVVFMPHPNAHRERTCASCISADKLDALRKVLV